MIMPKNQWAHAQVNPNGRCSLRRDKTCKTEKQLKEGAPAVVRWGKPPMLKLAKNVTEKEGFGESGGEEKSDYLCLRIPWVYIGRPWSSSRLWSLNGFNVQICNCLILICNRADCLDSCP
jgi:hypothetical protein